jgi:hypothetical protein
MSKFIRLVVSGLSLCGALAVLPGIAEARESGRPVAGHVVRGGGYEHAHGRGGERGWAWDHRRFDRGHCRWDGRFCR